MAGWRFNLVAPAFFGDIEALVSQVDQPGNRLNFIWKYCNALADGWNGYRLPVPVLDGGHLLFYLIELVTGHEVNLRWREMAQQIGFVLLVLLMIFVFALDIGRLNIKFLNDFLKLFAG